MFVFFEMIRDLWAGILGLFSNVNIPFVGDISVSLYELLLAFLVMAVIIGLFWRGVRA